LDDLGGAVSVVAVDCLLEKVGHYASLIYDRQVIVAVAEELDPTRRKAALASDRHRRIAALIHRWLSATLLDRLGILAVGRGCIRNHHIADGGLATVVYVHMLDADKLLPTSTQASENFQLHCIRLH
jgi:hypothetical protein